MDIPTFQRQASVGKFDDVAELIRSVIAAMYGGSPWNHELEKHLRRIVAEESEHRNAALIDSLQKLLAILITEGRIK